MKLKYILLLLFLTVAVALADSLPAARLGYWNRAYVGVSNGIPHNTIKYGNTIAAGSSATTINGAIAAANSGQYVLLGPGTFSLGGNRINLNKSGVTLRGSGATGANKTVLVFSSSGGGIKFSSAGGTTYSSGDSSFTTVNWTGGYTKGSNVITLQNAASFSVGDYIVLDQANESGGSFLMSDPYCEYGTLDTGWGRGMGTYQQCQGVKIVAKNNNDLTISPPLLMPNWNGTYNPRAWKPTVASAQSSFIGLEDLCISNTAGTPYAEGTMILIGDCNNSWVSNCIVSQADSSVDKWKCVMFWGAWNCEVRNCGFYGSSKVTQSDHYGVTHWWSYNCLVEDNWFDTCPCPMVWEPANANNVFSYNYATNMDDTYDANAYKLYSMSHGMNNYSLFEGNMCNMIYLDNVHSRPNHITLWRNRLYGHEPPQTAQNHAIKIHVGARSNSVVGNILGIPNAQYNFVTFGGYPGNGTVDSANPAIASLGLYLKAPDGMGGYYTPAALWNNDSGVPNSTFWAGNYDSVTVGLTYSNALASIDNSLIYSAKPAWFYDRPWPPYNPTNGILAGWGDRTNIPAGYRYVYGTNPPSGAAAPAITLTPSSLDYGFVNAGSDNGSNQTINVKNTGTATLSGDASLVGDTNFLFVSGTHYDLATNASTNITIRYIAGLENSNHSTASFSGLGISSSTAPIAGRLNVPQLLVNPTDLNFEWVSNTYCKTQSFQIANIGGSTLTGTIVVPAAPSTNFFLTQSTYSPFTNLPNEFKTINIGYTNSGADTDSVTIQIRTNGVLGASVTCTGRLWEPIISLSTNLLDFGPVAFGTIKTSSVQVANIGKGPLIGNATNAINQTNFVVVTGGNYTNMYHDQTGTVGIAYYPSINAADNDTIYFTGGGGATLSVTGLAAVSCTLPTFYATNGVLTGPMYISNYDGSFISTDAQYTPANSGRATYTFTVPSVSGTNRAICYVSALVNASNATANSFFIQMDAEPGMNDYKNEWTVGSLTNGTGGAWEDDYVNWWSASGSGAPPGPEFDPKVWLLSPGIHTMYLRGREPNTKVQTFTITVTNCIPPPTPLMVSATNQSGALPPEFDGQYLVWTCTRDPKYGFRIGCDTNTSFPGRTWSKDISPVLRSFWVRGMGAYYEDGYWHTNNPAAVYGGPWYWYVQAIDDTNSCSSSWSPDVTPISMFNPNDRSPLP